ncbi:MAG: hypothetical protein EXQ74_04060 [Thermoleophilia bacterium]|nr:hypothetical protein [Thermoleophilia bacterium]
MGGRAIATIILSGVVLVIGVAQAVRLMVIGGNPFGYVVAVAFIIAGGGRLWVWWRSGRA